MRENRGFSLVELLVAIAIASVVTGSIAYLLVTSLRMFNNETSDVAVQQELQVTINQIMDYAMESEFVSVRFDEDDSTINYLALGTISENGVLSARVFWQDENKLYLKKQDINEDSTNGYQPAIAAMVPATAGSSSNANLLAEYVKDFKVSVNGIVAGEGASFKNPLSLDISIDFEKSGSGKTVSKRVGDVVTLRNRVRGPIYINGVQYCLKTTSSKLKIETTTVKNEVNLGDLYFTISGNSSLKSKYTILEVVPSKGCSILGYLCDGKEPIDPYGVDAVANREVGELFQSDGHEEYIQQGIYNSFSNLFTNPESGSDANLYSYFLATGAFKGYFTKVSSTDRNNRGGVYAFNADAFSSSTPRYRFYSEYYDKYNNDSNYSYRDYCWVWNEWDKARDGETFPGDGYSSAGNGTLDVLINGAPITADTIKNAPIGARIYLTSCRKKKLINNELFVLHSLGMDKSLGGSFGLVESVNGADITYNFNNYNVIKGLKKENVIFKEITMDALTLDEVNGADLIVFTGTNEKNDVYSQAAKLYAIEDSSVNPDATDFYKYRSDISFEVMTDLYGRIIKNKLGILITRPTMQKFVYNDSNTMYRNIDNLFYMLFGFQNKNIVCVDNKIYGTTANTYHKQDADKVDGSSPYLSRYSWSGRYMWSDFFPSNLAVFENNKVEKFSDYSSGTLINGNKISTYIHFDNNGDIVGSSGTYSSLRKLGISDYGNSYNNVVTDKSIFEQYYKAKDFRPTSFTNEIGQFANQAIIESNGRFIRFYSNDPSGSLNWFKPIMNSVTNAQEDDEHDPIGTIEVVGAGVGADFFGTFSDESRWYTVTASNNSVYEKEIGFKSYQSPDPEKTKLLTYEESGIQYAHNLEESSEGKKFLYLTGYEYEKAKKGDAGLYIYILVRSTEDLKPYENPLGERGEPSLVYWKNIADQNNNTNGEPYTYPNSERNSGAVLYFKPNPDRNESFVALYRVHVSGFYFDGDTFNYPNASTTRFTPPNNFGNNKMLAKYKEGIFCDEDDLEEFYIVVRDEFDLD